MEHEDEQISGISIKKHRNDDNVICTHYRKPSYPIYFGAGALV